MKLFRGSLECGIVNVDAFPVTFSFFSLIVFLIKDFKNLFLYVKVCGLRLELTSWNFDRSLALE